MIKVCGPKDKPKASNNNLIINVTSSSKTLGKYFSPFFLGPINLPYNLISYNVENAWQFSKVYPEHISKYSDMPSNEWWEWAKKGWSDTYAHRYPMGKGAIPVYSYWCGKKLNYIEARKQIYIPIYTKAVKASKYYKELVELCKKHKDKQIYLFDYDGYDHSLLNYSYEDVINDFTRKMGHGFVLANILNRDNERNDF
jgi:hypothetical protein